MSPSRLAALAALMLTASAARAGDPPLQLYSLDDKGHVSVGGTRLETLTGGFDPNDFEMPNGTDRWSRMAVDGADRYLLRIDGRLERNGALLYELPFEIETLTPIWRELDVLDGSVAALRTDGLVTLDGVALAEHEDGKSLVFTDVLLVDMGGAAPAVFSLRNDGRVWRDGDVLPLFELEQPDSTFGFAEGKGVDTQWVGMAYQPGSGLVLALRADGSVRSFDPAGPPPPPPGSDDELPPEAGEPVAELPFVTKKKKSKFTQRLLYFDLGCTASGLFRAARNDGRVYGPEDLEEPLVDLPGKGNRRSQRYVDLLVLGEEHFVLRRDGTIFAGTSEAPLLRADGRAVVLAGSLEPPDLTGADPNAPRLGKLRARVVAGNPLVLPVMLSDVDTPPDELSVMVDLSGLPGASYDPETRLVTWPAAGAPGKYLVPVTVDDGLFVVERTQKISVLAPSSSAGNTAPLRGKYQPVPLLSGTQAELPIQVDDRDGDALIVELLPGDVADSGAVYDAEAGVLRWTPGLGDVGKATAKLSVSDGTATRNLKLRFEVMAPLIEPEAAP